MIQALWSTSSAVKAFNILDKFLGAKGSLFNAPDTDICFGWDPLPTNVFLLDFQLS